MSEYRPEFVRESEEQITELNNALLELENDPDDESAMEGIFRIAHTLKGNCGAMGLTRASDLAHAIEDLLDSARSGTVRISPEFMDTAFEGVDELETMIEEVGADGAIETDPSPTIEALRNQISYADHAPEISPPTDDEIDTVLARFDPPSNDDHDVFLVRLSIEPSETTNNGSLVVTALIDAFELIGTDPSQKAIENDEYGRRFDAVFASAVGETAIAAALEPVDAVADFEIVTVTDRLESFSGFPSFESGDIGGDISAEEAQDLSVDDLLDEFDELDDLDAMVEETEDDDLDAFDEMGDAGAFDELFADDEVDTDVETGDGDADDVVADADDDGANEVDDASAVFDELKNEVDMVGFDELQDELEELEFDEFDSEDEVDMAELLGEDIDTEDNSFLSVGAGTEAASDDESHEAATDEQLAEADGLVDPDDEVSSESGVGELPPSDVGDGAPDEGDHRRDDDAEDGLVVEEDSPADSKETADERTLEEAADLEDVDFGTLDAVTDAPDADSDDVLEAGPGEGEIDAGTPEADVDGDVVEDANDFDTDVDVDADVDVDVDDDFYADVDIGDDDFHADVDIGDDEEFEIADPDRFEESFADSGEFDDAAFEESFDDGVEFQTEGAGDGDEFDESVGFGDEGTPDADGESFTAYDEADSFEGTDAEFDHSLESDDGFEDTASDDDSATDERIFEENPEMEIPDVSVPEHPSQSRTNRESDQLRSVRVGTDQIDALLTLVEGLVTRRVRLRHAIETGADRATIDTELDGLDDITSELQETVMDVRLVPLETVTNRLPRVVRDIARDQDKEIEFEVSGEGIELDRGILDRIGDPLIHLVRNAVDHGIEAPDDREDAGKARTGTVEVRAERTRDRVTIEVEDDGTGLDPVRLRAEAVEADVLTESAAESLPDEELYELIFHAGLSTAEEVTDVSGRGVGMDVVKRTIDDLDGTVEIESEPGDGTTVTMTLPVTVTISDVLFLECAGEEFGVPVKAVHEIDTAARMETIDGREVVVDDDVEIPVVHLEELLSTPSVGANGDGMVVRIRDDVRSIALHCDQVHGQQEVVVKPFEGFMGDIPGLSGATVRGRGKVVNILDVNTL